MRIKGIIYLTIGTTFTLHTTAATLRHPCDQLEEVVHPEVRSPLSQGQIRIIAASICPRDRQAAKLACRIVVKDPPFPPGLLAIHQLKRLAVERVKRVGHRENTRWNVAMTCI